MPRAVPPDSCTTCRRRRIKCDGGRPVCRMCTRRHVHCDRLEPERRFVVYTTNPATSLLAQDTQDSSAIREAPTSAANHQTVLLGTCTIEDQNTFLIANPSSPMEDLLNETVAYLYHHYIEHLASWYDLCEHDRPFETLVPVRALEVPVVFNAIIAFSAQHKALHDSRYETCSMLYHSACIDGLLSGLDAFDASLQEDYLVAACLLRSFEILKADSRQEQRHLLGAYRFSSTEEIDMSTTGLLQAGAWNYLREEITVALECQRPVRLNLHLDITAALPEPDSMHANTITYILARVINHCFTGDDEQSPQFNDDERKELTNSLMFWVDSLPSTYRPYSQAPRAGNPFPSEWYLRPWHIAAAQYYLTAKTLLQLHDPNTEFDPSIVERLCGIAYTSDNKAARVNAFGPMAFCGRYLRSTIHQEGLKILLLKSSREIGWPIHRIIDDLETFWNRR